MNSGEYIYNVHEITNKNKRQKIDIVDKKNLLSSSNNGANILMIVF